MTPEDVRREAEELCKLSRISEIEEWLRSLLARDRREMAEEIGERFPELPGGSQLGDVKSWLLSKAEEMEKP